jgi:hypothetical protein
MVDAVLRSRTDLDPGRLVRTRQLMCQAVPDGLVTGFEPLVESLCLPDPGDRHVLAVAIKAGAQVIVTYNLRRFPLSALEPFDIEAQHPDDFLVSLLDLDEATVATAFTELLASLRKGTKTGPEVIDRLRRRGLVRTAERLGRSMI